MAKRSRHNADATELVTELMSISGRSGEEECVATRVSEYLLDAGLPSSAIRRDSAHRRSPLGGQTGNLIVKLPGTTRAPRRLLMAHLDTVPLCVGCEPYRDGDFIRSRSPDTALGGDNRAGTAVVLNAALEILRRDLPHPPLTLFWAVQEEVGLLGARYVSVSQLGKPRLCFNWDGADPATVTIGATGDIAMEIRVEGIASHAGAHPEKGLNAAAIASTAIAELVADGWHGLVIKGKQTGTSNLGVVSGGAATNVVMPSIDIKAEARSHSPTFRRRIVAAYEKSFRSASKSLTTDSGQRGKVHFESQLKYEAFRLSAQEPVVAEAVRAVGAAGFEARTQISNGGLDANWMTAHGLPTVTLGCGQQAIHTVDECLHVPSYLAATEVALQIATTT